MAEIPIQRKTGGGIWGWVIGALVILALLWFFFARNDRDDVTRTGADSSAMMADTSMNAPGMAPNSTMPGTTTPPAGTTTPPAGTPNPTP